MFCQPIRKALPDFARLQLNDSVMLFAEFHFTLGAHHAKTLDTANFADANSGINTRHINARLRNHHHDASACIGRAANDLAHAS